MPQTDGRIKVTYRIAPSLYERITAFHQTMVIEHKAGPNRWRRSPSVNDAAERIFTSGLVRQGDGPDIKPVARSVDRVHAGPKRAKPKSTTKAHKRTIKASRKGAR
jgi:hypothetical protein